MAKFTNCIAEGNIEGGFKVGKNSELIDCIARGNVGPGFQDVEYSKFLEDNNLPKEVDAQELADLLTEIAGKDQATAEAIVEKSNLLTKLGKYSPSASIVASLLSISANPNVHKFVEWLTS